MCRIQTIASISALLALVAGCSTDLSPLNSTHLSSSSAPAPAAPPAGLGGNLTDFETNPFSDMWGPWGPPPFSQTWTTDPNSHSGTHCLRYQSGASQPGWAWGTGLGYTGSFSGATRLEFYYRINTALTFYLHWDEGTTLGDGDDWSYTITLSPNSNWTLASVQLSNFTTGTAGHLPNPEEVIDVWFDANSPVVIPHGAFDLTLDDFSFK